MASLVVPSTITANTKPTAAQFNTFRDALMQVLGQSPTGGQGSLDWAKLRQTSTQTLSSNTWTTLTMDVEDRDDASGHAGTSGVYTVAVAGELRVECGGVLAANATGIRGIRVLKNSTAVQGRVIVGNAGGSNTTELTLGLTITCAAGDTLAAQSIQTSGGNLATAYVSPDEGSFLNVKWVSA